MRTSERKIYGEVKRIVNCLKVPRDSREDLAQEGFLHFYCRQRELPGQTESFYLESCRLFVLNCLKTGRSLDAPKRSRHRCSIEDVVLMADTWLGNTPSNLVQEEQATGEATAREIARVLIPRLRAPEPQILLLLESGFGIREVARRMGLSHPAVLKHKRRIAKVAVCCGLVAGAFGI